MKNLISLAILQLLWAYVNAQPRFSRITPEDGLSTNVVRQIMQDSRGFIWAASTDGLNFYDGRAWKVFRNNPEDENSLGHNNTYCLAEDQVGRIWIGTLRGGLHIYDPLTHRFQHLYPEPGNTNSMSSDEIVSLFVDSKGNTWAGTRYGANRIVPIGTDSFAITQFRYLDDSAKTEVKYVNAIVEIESGEIIMGSRAGIIKLDKLQQQLTPVHLAGNPEARTVECMVYKDGQLYVGTYRAGILIARVKTNGELELLQQYPTNGEKIPASPVSDLVLDGNVLWVGTALGLVKIENPGTIADKVSTFTYDPQDPFSLSNKEVSRMMLAHDGSLWISTANGLNILQHHQKPFHTWNSRNNGLSADIVLSFWQDGDSLLWIATSEGLDQFDLRKGRTMQTFPPAQPGKEGPASIRINGVYRDSIGNLWLACYLGLTKMFMENGKYHFKIFTHVATNSDAPSTDRLYSLLPDGDNLWMSSIQGLLRFNLKNETFTEFQFDSANHFTFLEKLPSGKYFCGSQLGAYIFDDKTGTFKEFSFEENNFVFHNKRLKSYSNLIDGQLWVGAGDGLYQIDFNKKSISHFYEKHGLPNTTLDNVQMDNEGNVWFTHGRGLSRLNTATAKFDHFSLADGLQESYFLRSIFKNKNGRIYIGGYNGLTWFNPLEIKLNNYQPPVYILNMSIFNEPVPVGQPDSTLQNHRFFIEKDISATRKVELSWRYDVVSFDFASLNYLYPEKNHYAYKLEGFDDDWIESGTRNFATYTNLDPGSYTLHVRGSNNDGVWSSHEASLQIIVSPPWWRTWWAYILYAFMAVAMVYSLMRYRLKRQREQLEQQAQIERVKLHERELMRKKSSEDFHDVNGNKLTKIALYAELAKTEANAQTIKYIRKLEEHVKGLSTGIRDFLWTLDPEKDSLQEMLERMRQFGDEIFQYSSTNFKSDFNLSNEADHKLTMDSRRQILLIFQEAMNNVLKYAVATEVVLIAASEKTNLVITLSDNGKGFDEATTNDGYGLGNMKSRAKRIGGELQITSQPAKGTSVHLQVDFTYLGDSMENGNAIVLKTKATNHE